MLKALKIVLCLMLFISCLVYGSSSNHNRTGLVEFDEYVRNCDKIFETAMRVEKINLVNNLERKLLHMPSDKGRRAVVQYYHSRLSTDIDNDYNEALIYIKRALYNVDSVEQAYDFHRFRTQKALIHILKGDSFLDSYISLISDIDYYKTHHHPEMMAKAYSTLGQLFFRLEAYERALGLSKRAGEIYDSIGHKDISIRNSLNIASALFMLKDKHAGDSILRLIQKDMILRRDTAFYIKLLQLKAATGDMKAASDAYKLAVEFKSPWHVGRIAGVRGYFFEQLSQLDSAVIYYRKSLESTSNSNVARQMVYYGLSKCYLDKEKYDSAAYYSNLAYTFYVDSIIGNNLGAIYRVESIAAIDRYEKEISIANERNRNKTLISILVISLLVVALGFIIYVYIHHKRISDHNLQRMQKQVYQSDRELMSSQLLISDNERLLADLLNEITESDITSSSEVLVSSIRNQIKIHQSFQDQWGVFLEKFEKVHPLFIKSLSQAAPRLTEGEIRMCIYIFLGLDNKHIAQLLSLQPNSVKVARYRIRKKLPITTEISLENYLRSI